MAALYTHHPCQPRQQRQRKDKTRKHEVRPMWKNSRIFISRTILTGNQRGARRHEAKRSQQRAPMAMEAFRGRDVAKVLHATMRLLLLLLCSDSASS